LTIVSVAAPDGSSTSSALRICNRPHLQLLDDPRPDPARQQHAVLGSETLAQAALDEPSEGLMPTLVGRLLDTIVALKARQVGILLVEQKVDAVLRVADRVALIENGRIARHATPAELAAEPEVLLRYVGVRR
jgi:ABC-type branched-subunit amino acid transport system ATPase component